MVETTKLTPANTTKSLRTTVPMPILKQLDLTENDYLDWSLDKVDNEWIITIRKKQNK